MCSTGEASVDWKQVLPDGMVKIGVSSRARDNQLFSSDPSTGTHLSSSPMLRDPYEAKVGSLDVASMAMDRKSLVQVVDVRPSSIPGAGMGVFAVKPLSSRTIVGYFNGVHRHRKEVFSSGEDSAYLVEGGLPNEMLDVPNIPNIPNILGRSS